MAAPLDTPRTRGDSDAPHTTLVTPAEDARTIMINQVAWGAIFAGVVAALAVQLVINLLGIGIGAATLDPAGGGSPTATSFSIGAAIWWIASGVIASFVGGMVAGRMSGRPKASTTAWHGLIAWAATTLVIVYLLTSAVGGLLGGVMNTVSGALGGLGRTAATAAPQIANATDPFAAIERRLRQATGGTDPAALRDASVNAIRALVTGDPAQVAQAREQAAQALAASQNIPVEQARTQVQEYEAQYRKTVDQAKQQATEAADATAKVVSRGALFSFFALVLGAMAGWFGGRMGAVDPTVTANASMVGRR